ncbi:HAD family hydrolase [Candidatus Pacearchaeota archaeon]|nr:HAD family hydrolase [Candidatus Pacearchaeota archaeon]
MVIKLVLFDADGTLWGFTNNKDRVRRLNEAVINKDVLPLLNHLKKRNIPCKLLTYQQYNDKRYSQRKIKYWLKHFNLLRYFNEIFIADKNNNIKEEIIKKILSSNRLEKNEIMFIGDRYKWDYLPAKNTGIKAILLDNPDNKIYKVKKYTFKQLIKSFNFY